MGHTVIVHHADGECSTEGTHQYRDSAMWHAINLAENLERGKEWVMVLGLIVQGRKISVIAPPSGE